MLLDVDPGTERDRDPVAEAVRGARPTASPCSAAPTPGLAARLAERGLRRPVARAATLRERFGLPRPANYFAGAHR